MKQTLAMLFVTALLLFSLAGCGEKKDSNTANGPSTGTTDNGAADSGKKKDNMPGDDMSGENKKDDSVTGDGMMGDDMDGDGENTTRSRPPQCRRERQRPQPLFWQRQDHHARKRQPLRQDLSEPRDGKERKRAAAQQRPQFDRHKYQWNLERCALPADAVERPRARHGRLFVRRRKYALQHPKVKKAGAACSRLAFAVLTNRIHLDIMKYNRKEVPPYGS